MESNTVLRARIEALTGLDLEALRREWRRLHRRTPPSIFKRDLLLRGLVHRLSCDAEGDLDRKTEALLTALAAAPDPAAVLARQRTRTIKPGCEIRREWNGTMQRVIVLEKGFAWDGKVYPSLSMVARAITGTRWNGYRFFGIGGPQETPNKDNADPTHGSRSAASLDA
jgi:Protein of unknown function (DUF2924)